jgi:septal ring factor EnvC (AmiA/AmiB activator)
MKTCKRILAGLTMLLGVAGLLLSVTGGVGIWIVKEKATSKATKIFGRIEAALDLADKGLDHVEASLDKAEERLGSVKEEQKKLAQDPKKNGQRGRDMARAVQQKIAPDLDGARETFLTVAEAAVVVNSILEDARSLPFFSVSGLEGDGLKVISSRLSQVESTAWNLTRLLGEPEPDPDAAGDQLSQIEVALTTARRSIADYKTRVTQVRDRAEELKSRTLFWINLITVVVSLVCFWIALSQVSLLCHARSWWRHSRCAIPRPT